MANPTPSSTTSRTMDDVKDKASEAASQAKDTASSLADSAKSTATDRLDEQKRHATGALSDVADALHETSDSLREHDRDAFARYAESAASQVETLTQSLRSKNVGELIDDVERFARRDAGLFIGGAFLLGILGGRFLKASSPSASRSGSYASREYASSPYRTAPRPATGYGSYGSPSYGAGSTTPPGSYGDQGMSPRAATGTAMRTTNEPFPGLSTGGATGGSTRTGSTTATSDASPAGARSTSPTDTSR